METKDPHNRSRLPGPFVAPIEQPTQKPRSLPAARAEAAHCQRCPLFAHATQTVFGEGPVNARVMLIGEQPGDREDREGHPFVGPAGALLDRALAAAGIDRRKVYVTNAVKHFKWVPVRKKRLHQKPNAREIRACRYWLEAELTFVMPDVVVALGATAAQTLMGPTFRVTQSRGKIFETQWTQAFIATLHPSALLRAPAKDRDRMFDELVADLKIVASTLAKLSSRVKA